MDPSTGVFTEMEDAELVQEAARGEIKAVAVLYDRFAGLLLSLGQRMLGDPTVAEDLVQDLLMEVWRQAHTFDESRGSVRTWLLVRLRSRALDRLRSARVRREIPVGSVSLTEGLSGDSEDAELSPDRAMVRQIIAQLPDEQREVIELSYFYGLSSSEIAERMKSPLGTVKSRIAAALAKLRMAMSDTRSQSGGLS